MRITNVYELNEIYLQFLPTMNYSNILHDFVIVRNSIVKRIGIVVPKILLYLARNKQKRISKTWLFIIMC